jgi:Skp family chaperone for outer membrane proteins
MKKNIYKFFIVLFLSLFIIKPTIAEEIYYINTIRVLGKSELTKILDKLRANKEAELRKKYKIDLKKFRAGQRVKETDIQRLQAYQRDLQDFYLKLTFNSQKFVGNEIKKFASKYGYDAIVAEVLVMYVNDKYDITDKFLKFLNSEIRKNKAKVIRELKK